MSLVLSSRQLQLTSDEQDWQKQLSKRAQQAFLRNRPEQLPFLTPREQMIAAATLNLEVVFDGGFSDAQRKRAIIGGGYGQADCLLLEATYNNRFYSLQHKDVLGALMSLGVEREQFGDIRLDDQRIQLACTKTIAKYLQQQLTQIGKVPIEFVNVDWSQALPSDETVIEQEIIVASLRLDAIVAELLHCSRKQAQQQIQSQLVQCNYQMMTKNDFECQIGDLLSIRRFGRVVLLEQRAQTRKGNKIVLVGCYHERK
ncbi:MAG: RNA-binding protein [Culicoidibacterales bacterium]